MDLPRGCDVARWVVKQVTRGHPSTCSVAGGVVVVVVVVGGDGMHYPRQKTSSRGLVSANETRGVFDFDQGDGGRVVCTVVEGSRSGE